jgi:hypothetical protein
MSIARSANYIPAVPSSATPEEIAQNVSRWQARHQPVMPKLEPPSVPIPTVSPIETAPHLREAAANWFAEVRRQDNNDQEEIRERVQKLMGKGLLD